MSEIPTLLDHLEAKYGKEHLIGEETKIFLKWAQAYLNTNTVSATRPDVPGTGLQLKSTDLVRVSSSGASMGSSMGSVASEKAAAAMGSSMQGQPVHQLFPPVTK